MLNQSTSFQEPQPKVPASEGNRQRPLSARDRALYVAIVEHKSANDGCSPSTRDLMQATDITSTSVLRYHLKRLEAAGLITLDHGVARSIRVTGGAWSHA